MQGAVKGIGPVVSRPRALAWLCGGLFAIGLLSRVAPFFNQQDRLFRQFPTEDGYLMLTIARNLALGLGMSTAQGTMPTNGTQPLFNFVEAVGFWMFGGDRWAGVAWALGCELLLSCACAYGIYLLAQRTFQQRVRTAPSVALLASAAWFSSPIVVPNSMNCLETGLYVTLITYAVIAWQKVWLCRQSQAVDLWGALRVGLVLGLTFWARIDAVFLIAAITGTHVALGFIQDRSSLRPRLLESLLMGSVSVLVGSPWLMNNLVNFGSLMPISGTAQSLTATFGGNLGEVPSKLLEYVGVVVPIPQRFESHPLALLIEVLVLLIYVLTVGRIARKADGDEAAVAVVFACLAAFLVGYYGLTFGATHFVGRYLFPLSIPLAIASALLVVSAAQWLAERRGRTPLLISGVGLLALVLGLNLRLYRNGAESMHFQVVEYVRDHVEDDVWVGAIQTGTLGFFHDRTVNLDGKVNPEALRMALAKKIPQYVVEARFGTIPQPIEWLADWQEIASWIEYEPISSHFEVAVRDPILNLGVLKRRPAATDPHAARSRPPL